MEEETKDLRKQKEELNNKEQELKKKKEEFASKEKSLSDKEHLLEKTNSLDETQNQERIKTKEDLEKQVAFLFFSLFFEPPPHECFFYEFVYSFIFIISISLPSFS